MTFSLGTDPPHIIILNLSSLIPTTVVHGWWMVKSCWICQPFTIHHSPTMISPFTNHIYISNLSSLIPNSFVFACRLRQRMASFTRHNCRTLTWWWTKSEPSRGELLPWGTGSQNGWILTPTSHENPVGVWGRFWCRSFNIISFQKNALHQFLTQRMEKIMIEIVGGCSEIWHWCTGMAGEWWENRESVERRWHDADADNVVKPWSDKNNICKIPSGYLT